MSDLPFVPDGCVRCGAETVPGKEALRCMSCLDEAVYVIMGDGDE